MGRHLMRPEALRVFEGCVQSRVAALGGGDARSPHPWDVETLAMVETYRSALRALLLAIRDLSNDDRGDRDVAEVHQTDGYRYARDILGDDPLLNRPR